MPRSRLAPRLVRLALAATLVAVLAAAASACPTCASGMAEQSDGGDLVSGYQWSILFMMGMPFAILTGLGGYVYYEVRKARQKQQPDREESLGG